ncbi:hypothetical protein EMIHUDRAFT_200972 [Emiliania huxleyi CCMP1516]|uniref:Uncharacterized protein n=2 Tax=Emiliania huxleyi TaxID=2903 RepID=A0A0D3KLY2_EMIH1|nr:hypothetical protein EMIHUDRAFT_200972 [Emiliania huxleyi CCMP1516]EOD36767.1 hypothetical protein EMIHUDRAFT_200972 [Emiliania huxleyi CCMP1516]|eukprot:XP_005789196.1 hypothetical protein EMIHUDRAFT_200972 [Emiliania huxleyi CCMP1516]
MVCPLDLALTGTAWARFLNELLTCGLLDAAPFSSSAALQLAIDRLDVSPAALEVKEPDLLPVGGLAAAAALAGDAAHAQRGAPRRASAAASAARPAAAARAALAPCLAPLACTPLWADGYLRELAHGAGPRSWPTEAGPRSWPTELAHMEGEPSATMARWLRFANTLGALELLAADVAPRRQRARIAWRPTIWPASSSCCRGRFTSSSTALARRPVSARSATADGGSASGAGACLARARSRRGGSAPAFCLAPDDLS